jgi:hypothetical protein
MGSIKKIASNIFSLRQIFIDIYSVYPGVEGMIILRWIFWKWDVWVWTGSIWLRIGTGGGHL